MPPSRFTAFVEYLLDNLFDIVTIFVAAYLVIRHQIVPFTSNDIVDLATWMLGVLGLIAVSGLWDRNRRLQRIENLSRDNHELVHRYISGKIRASDFFLGEKLPLTDKYFARASDIVLSGITLERTLRSYMHTLSMRLVNGSSIRILLLEPEVSLLQELAEKHWATADYWRSQIQISQELVKIIASTQDRKGEIKVGYLPYIPSFGFTIIDAKSVHGLCRVNIYHHKKGDTNPTFELNRNDDPIWYNFFVEQFEILWASCRIETLLQSKEIPTEK